MEIVKRKHKQTKQQTKIPLGKTTQTNCVVKQAILVVFFKQNIVDTNTKINVNNKCNSETVEQKI